MPINIDKLEKECVWTGQGETYGTARRERGPGAGVPADLVFSPQEGCHGRPVCLCSHTFCAITQNFLSVLCVGPHGSHANASVQGVLLTGNMGPLKAS